MFETLAQHLSLGSLLDALSTVKQYRILTHWPQGEFHHDLVIHIPDFAPELTAPVLVISSDCNGGVKELICMSAVPPRWSLWHHRCPTHPDFPISADQAQLPLTHGWIRTSLWQDPCALLTWDAPSELKPEARRRQIGGGWELDPVVLQQ